MSIKNKINPRYRQGDWVCNNCQNMNFAFRSTCNRCDAQKEKGFKSALFLKQSNGDIPPISDRSHKSSEFTQYSFDKLPSMEPILSQIKKDQKKYDIFEFEWQCQKCQANNQYYKTHCNQCGSQRFRKLTA